jgi:uncharacterized protein (DUF305 family)
METKPLLFGLIGFFLGGLLVSVAATTFDKPTDRTSDMTMNQMTEDLQSKTGDDFDKAFIVGMIKHHVNAIEMAKLSANNAKHDKIKSMSQNIISTQQSEIDEMKRWQAEWYYSAEHKKIH